MLKTVQNVPLPKVDFNLKDLDGLMIEDLTEADLFSRDIKQY